MKLNRTYYNLLLLAMLLLLALTACNAAQPASEPGGQEPDAPVLSDDPTPADSSGGPVGETPMPVEPDGGIGTSETSTPVEPDGGIGTSETPMPVEPDGGIGDGAVTPAPGELVVGPPAMVEEVQVLTLESFPVQINAVVRGVLPDQCTQLGEVTQVRDGNNFRVTISTLRPADAICAEQVQPFEQTISLDVMGLPAGDYQVEINDVTGSFSLAQDNIMTTE